jgi:Phosphate-induced protein 1 conserved region
MHRFAVRKLVVAAVVAACAMSVQAAKVQAPDEEEELVPTGKGWGERAAPGHAAGKAAGPNGSNGISYHGGPLLTGGVNAYYIWYGNWSGNSATTILTDLAKSLGGSPYFDINATYYDGSNVHVANIINYAGSTTDNYSHGTALSDGNIQAIVADAITSGRLPSDKNAAYFVLTSADVNETSGFCTQYCGWHTHGTIAGSDIKYAFIGNPDRCPSACEAQTTGPNGNAGADGMASIISHELEEATTDPDLNAWYDRRGEENADKCAWTFGSTYRASNGALANMKLGSRDYLIQQNWVNASGGYCAKQYP